VDPRKGAPMINARADTIARLPRFRAAYARRRCLVPADGFYEWREEGGVKQPYLVRRRDRAPLAFAGIWDRWKSPDPAASPAQIDSFAIITTSANALLHPVHSRMPVILDPADFARWLDPDGDAAALQSLLRPAPEDWLGYSPVSTRVNGALPEDPGLAEPIGPETVASD